MKKMILFPVMIAALSMTACHDKEAKTEVDAKDSISAVETKNSEKAFKEFAEHFSDSTFYARTEMNGKKVLLVSREVFSSDEYSGIEGVEATVFALDKKGKILCLGSVRSQGSNYPVSMLDGKLMVAGHQFVNVYAVRGDELVLDTCQEGYGEEMEQMYEMFFKGTSVKFQKTISNE